MDIYHYDEITGVLLSQGQAMEDPLEPGRWLVPRWATLEVPGEETEGMEQFFDGAAWKFREIEEVQEGDGA